MCVCVLCVACRYYANKPSFVIRFNRNKFSNIFNCIHFPYSVPLNKRRDNGKWEQQLARSFLFVFIFSTWRMFTKLCYMYSSNDHCWRYQMEKMFVFQLFIRFVQTNGRKEHFFAICYPDALCSSPIYFIKFLVRNEKRTHHLLLFIYKYTCIYLMATTKATRGQQRLRSKCYDNTSVNLLSTLIVFGAWICDSIALNTHKLSIRIVLSREINVRFFVECSVFGFFYLIYVPVLWILFLKNALFTCKHQAKYFSFLFTVMIGKACSVLFHYIACSVEKNEFSLWFMEHPHQHSVSWTCLFNFNIFFPLASEKLIFYMNMTLAINLNPVL